MAKGKFSAPRGPKPTQPPRSRASAPERSREDLNPYLNPDRSDGRRNPAAQKNRKIVLISLLSVAVVLVIAVIVGVLFYNGTLTDDGLILNNVTAAGINLGGMTKDQAETALHRATDLTYSQQNMVVTMPDAVLEFSPADTGVSLDIEAVTDAAYEYGRTGSKEEREKAKADSMVSNHPIALLPYLNLNKDFIRASLEEYGRGFNSTFAPSSVTVLGEAPVLEAAKETFNKDASGQTLVIALGNPGRYLDIERVYNQVLDAYSFNTFAVTAEMDKPEQMPDPIDLQLLHSQYQSDPRDAEMDKDTFEVIPEIYGYGFDLEQAQAQLDAAVYGDTFEIKVQMIPPKVLGEDLSDVLFRDVLGSFETKHTKDANRNTNLTLACAAINGYVLEPGEIFDYNKVLGKRTAEKGYKAAGAYSSGMTVKELGGGICQVSSTLYYCTLVADLEVVKRSPHSFVSSYMPMGMDASVSWGGPEFRFKNSTNYPIRIEAEVSDGMVKVKLIGTDEKDYYIKMEYEVVSTVYPTTVTEEIPSDNNPNGYRDGQVISTPYTGYTVKTYKCKYDKETDELIVREFDKTSVYNKRDKTIASIVAPSAPTDPPTEPVTPPTDQTVPPETQAPPTSEPPTTPPETQAPPSTDATAGTQAPPADAA